MRSFNILSPWCLLSFGILLAHMGFEEQSLRAQDTGAMDNLAGDNRSGIFRPLPPAPENLPPEKIALGEKLFHDPVLSLDNTVSCASCHILSDGGDDNQQFSVGVTGKNTPLNSPTVFNLSGHVSYFWDGRASSLADQLDMVLNNPDEMGINWQIAVDRLNGDPAYRQEFAEIYGGPATRETISDAIVTYEKTLATPESAYDRYLAGDKEAMSPEARRGMQLFSAVGCISCHQGPLFGANLYQKIGIFEDYFPDPDAVRPEDYGRFNVTGREEDKFYFKVPSLRNVAVTAPYFHDGTKKTLEEAVHAMAYYQLGGRLTDTNVKEIVAFLNALTSDALLDAQEAGQ